MRRPATTVGFGFLAIVRQTIRAHRRPAQVLANHSVVAVVVLGFVASGCGGSGSDTAEPVDDTMTPVDARDNSTTTTSTTSTTTTTTSTTVPPTLEERIVADMQGAQSEYLDWFGESGSGIVFFHHGDWAAEAVEKSGEYCLRATYTWSIADATSESDFTIHYDTLIENPDCVDLGVTRLTAVFSGSEEVDGRAVYDFTYTEGVNPPFNTGTRTLCSDQWNDPDPCGLALAGFEMPTPPQS